jgi:transcriptional regulator with XRE-family HTH domain
MTRVTLGDEAVLVEIGQRLRRIRIDTNLTQSSLARQAGVGRSTVERLESGQSVQLANFIRIMRVLGLLERFVQALPEPGISPMDLLELKSRKRERARRRKSPAAAGDSPWRWGDEK